MTSPLAFRQVSLGKFMQAAILARMELITTIWAAAQKEDGWAGTGKRWGAAVWEHQHTFLALLDHYAPTGDQAALQATKENWRLDF